jgi:hypothetical protein
MELSNCRIGQQRERTGTEQKLYHLVTLHGSPYLMSHHLSAVDVTDCVQQVVRLINDDNTAFQVNAACLASVLMEEGVVRNHYYLCK